jgi:fibro-slime domain-containing protein
MAGTAGTAAGAAGSGTGARAGGSTSGGAGSGGSGGMPIVPVGESGAGGAQDTCNPRLVATIRDFDSSHPDFENEDFISPDYARVEGIVEARLQNGVPALADAAPDDASSVTDAASFATWFSTDHPKSATYLFDLDSGYLDKDERDDGVIVYWSDEFFPIDDEPSAEPGFEDEEGNEHNYHFTLELNTRFTYREGDTFEFTGDDDIWIFIEDELVVDLGGVHHPDSDEIDLDTLNLTPGQTYGLSLFYAERHTTFSNFRMSTTIVFNNCDPIIR